ncbi:glycoside hydrolase family 27 protein [Sphingomonas nostoxanthinifaciens]|uniref:glycoside hydrolase family 27 protein n=1 Tax=Sphingomonas nostoxanthinifaciens TaxID=2872652 RepID=UPI001CC1D0F7|nr:glycoside hydrolase family 27 protein [Sphingomonas nostoxanthinifaciens]UAK26076.1 glycoside hydrolase family 27 protein [Sphingomonas nostoxanthinifaciens]
MSGPQVDRRAVLAGGALAAAPLRATGGKAGASLAPRPPMGWNSWNSFATTITEAQALETARIMAAKLLPAGYDVFTVDIQWYEPDANSYTYNAHPKPAMDAHGRLQPAPNRFPSSADGSGFTRLAQQVHALGLRFGIHVMRGIPRAAVEANLPVFGTSVRARDIADTSSTCPWNPDMYGVDMRRPGAQAWYDGLFRMYAGWGVDFVKMDDMSRPYDAHAPEIEAAHRAIGACGRPIILSLSPGETPVARADHVRANAQMWRIGDDFWDEWPLLEAQFTRLENWNAHRSPGCWPDADMLPLGRLKLGARDTQFTPDEQRTLMTLWSVARSPLIMGGDLRHLDAPTLALLTNPEVIAVNQSSSGNQPHFLMDGLRVWTARGHDGADIVALFNTDAKPLEASIRPDRIGLRGPFAVRDLWARRDLPGRPATIAATLPPHGAALLGVRSVG